MRFYEGLWQSGTDWTPGVRRAVLVEVRQFRILKEHNFSDGPSSSVDVALDVCAQPHSRHPLALTCLPRQFPADDVPSDQRRGQVSSTCCLVANGAVFWQRRAEQ
eukprot:3136134-Rhodomonas_salina.1